MRSMKQLEIFLDKTVYQPGGLIHGTIILRIDKEMKVRYVDFSIIGEEKTRVSVQSGKSSYKYSDSYFVMYVNKTIFGEGILQPDEYRSDFSIQIPPNALPTYSGINTDVYYKVQAHADVPLWFDVKTKKGFTVLYNPEVIRAMARPISFATDNYMDYSTLGLRVEYQGSGFGKPKPSFSVELDSNTYLAGDNITGRVRVKNPTKKRIRKLDVVLRAKEYASAGGYSNNITVEKLKSKISFDDLIEDVPTQISIPIPRTVRTGFSGAISRLTWYLELNLDVAYAFDVKTSQELAIYQWQG